MTDRPVVPPAPGCQLTWTLDRACSICFALCPPKPPLQEGDQLVGEPLPPLFPKLTYILPSPTPLTHPSFLGSLPSFFPFATSVLPSFPSSLLLLPIPPPHSPLAPPSTYTTSPSSCEPHLTAPHHCARVCVTARACAYRRWPVEPRIPNIAFELRALVR